MNEAYRSLRTRQELRQAAAELLKPLVPCMTRGKARIYVGQGSAHYPEGCWRENARRQRNSGRCGWKE